MASRRLEFGPNRIERTPPPPFLIRFLKHFTHFFAILLWIAAMLALVADSRMPGQGMATLAAAMVAVIVINGAFSFWQEYRAEETMGDGHGGPPPGDTPHPGAPPAKRRDAGLGVGHLHGQDRYTHPRTG